MVPRCLRAILLLAAVSLVSGQTTPKFVYPGSSDCATKKPMCIDPTLTFETGRDTGLSLEPDIPTNPFGGWGSCMRQDREINSAWYWFKANTSGRMEFRIVSNEAHDLDFMVWGPFDTIDLGCGSNLKGKTSTSPGSEQKCGWQRGPTILANENQEPYSLENVTVPNAVAGKYYTMLINDQGFQDDGTGNSTFYFDPRIMTGASDCEALRGANLYTVQANRSVPVVGESFNISFHGFRLSTVAFTDAAKAVRSTDSCEGPSFGADREGNNLGPGDAYLQDLAVWTVTFLLPGSYKVCYKPYDSTGQRTWTQIGDFLLVDDLRTRPGERILRGVVDAPPLRAAPWISYYPTQINAAERARLTFFGFEPYGYPHVDVKVVVASCLENSPSVLGSKTQTLEDHHTAVFTIDEVGKYMVCVKHRNEWEQVDGFLTVTTPDKLGPYYNYTTCEEFLRANPPFCGCFYDQGGMPDSPMAVLPMDFPNEELLCSVSSPLINQGCCARNTAVRKLVVEPTAPKVVNWGYCSES